MVLFRKKMMVCMFWPSPYHTMPRKGGTEQWDGKLGEFYRHGLAIDHPAANFLLV